MSLGRMSLKRKADPNVLKKFVLSVSRYTCGYLIFCCRTKAYLNCRIQLCNIVILLYLWKVLKCELMKYNLIAHQKYNNNTTNAQNSAWPPLYSQQPTSSISIANYVVLYNFVFLMLNK